MKIKRLELTNFRCFDQFDIDFDEQLTVLVAANGEGKTAVLDAVAVGLGAMLTRLPNVSGIKPKDTDVRVLGGSGRVGMMRIGMESFSGVAWERTSQRGPLFYPKGKQPKRIGLRQLYDYVDGLMQDMQEGQPVSFPTVAYFGTGRGVFDAPQRRRNFQKEFGFEDGYRDALTAKANFRQFFQFFYYLEDLERRAQQEKRDFDVELTELNALRQAITRMMPDFSNPRSALRPLRFLIDWHHGDKSRTLRIEQLSDGYRTTLAMVMDIAARMAELNSHSGQILNGTGVVLIDEIDLHLHPEWQQRILGDLTRTFPGLQFIVTTHSPQVLTSIRREHIRTLGTAQDGNFVASVPLAASYGESSADVLESIMHVDPQPPVSERSDLRRLVELVDQGHYETAEARTLFERLGRQLRPDHPQLQRVERSIRRQKALNK